MQIQTGPAIPTNSRYLYDTGNEFNVDKSGDGKSALNTYKGDNRKHTSNSFPQQQEAATIFPSNSKQSYGIKDQKSNGKTIYRSPRRPKGTLTIQHLYLYSSSSPDNLVANNSKHPNSSADLNYDGGQKAHLQSPNPSHEQDRASTGAESYNPT
ncbi:hypothetical protein BCR42DRAFT_122404 [Absidia repens]|uniref:Uncharacterized protein n=1 Tax=Absidia repens TaxID=90262 RepID=A0A1X2I4K7_9FUNG|nr:hypothetical protein BCR42DRAFT_122404 [Absidia repens]